MKVVEFSDIDGQKIFIRKSSLATQDAYRIYINSTPEGDDGAIHLNHNQAEILINALQDLFNDGDL